MIISNSGVPSADRLDCANSRLDMGYPFGLGHGGHFHGIGANHGDDLDRGTGGEAGARRDRLVFEGTALAADMDLARTCSPARNGKIDQAATADRAFDAGGAVDIEAMHLPHHPADRNKGG